MNYVINLVYESINKSIFNVQQIKVLDARKLEVVPLVDRNKLHFALHTVKNMIPNVIVKVRPLGLTKYAY